MSTQSIDGAPRTVILTGMSGAGKQLASRYFEDMHWRGGNGANFDTGSTNDSAWISPLGAINTMRNPMNNRNTAWLQGAGDVRCHGWSSPYNLFH